MLNNECKLATPSPNVRMNPNQVTEINPHSHDPLVNQTHDFQELSLT
jgi:hypothetical protein